MLSYNYDADRKQLKIQNSLLIVTEIGPACKNSESDETSLLLSFCDWQTV